MKKLGPPPTGCHAYSDRLPSQAEAERTVANMRPWNPGYEWLIGCKADGWYFALVATDQDGLMADSVYDLSLEEIVGEE